ncbi:MULTISPECIES: hypothetical protein [unclassified Luteococcus]|uniref:hypothetical protein n=1 Tax=unclassified Luteococcus TaxID=2639923 RepID=UPI00313CE833
MEQLQGPEAARAAEWLDLGPDEWARTVAFGPAGFPAYARLRFIPDPQHPGQREADVTLPDDHPDDLQQVSRALTHLLRWTKTPDDLLVAFWDGAAEPPSTGRPLGSPSLNGHARSYHLFSGAPGDWLFRGAPGDWAPGIPAFVWPADRAWCLANDVDPHWAGIGARAGAIQALLRAPDLDIVPATRTQEPPHYS